MEEGRLCGVWQRGEPETLSADVDPPCRGHSSVRWTYTAMCSAGRSLR